MPYLLGIDIGTYSSKGVLVDAAGRVLSKAERPHDLSIPRQGWAEHDADGVWWSDFCAISKELIGTAGVGKDAIKGVGVSAIAPCALPVDDEGKPLRPGILYGIDTRAVDEIAELELALGKPWILESSGSDLSAQSAGPKILWLKRKEPEVWRRARTFHTATSFIVFRLTGRSAIDHYTAAFFGPLYDIRKLGWSERAAERICGLGRLPEPMWTTEVAGAVTPRAAEESGLAVGTPVIAGTADASAEAVSAGVSSPGEAMLMYGSSLFIIALTDTLARGGVFWPAPFLYPRTYALAGGMATAGSVTEWFRRNFSGRGGKGVGSEGGGGSDFGALAAGAAAIPPGSEGLVVLPYFSGERTPINDPRARGVVAGLSLRHGGDHLYRAILEGVAYGVRHNLEEMAAAGTAPASLYAVGGGTKNRLWMQIVSDVLGRPQTVRDTVGAAFGDAFLAGVGTKVVPDSGAIRDWVAPGQSVEPDAASRELYDRYYELYRSLYRESADTVHGLSKLSEREK